MSIHAWLTYAFILLAITYGVIAFSLLPHAKIPEHLVYYVDIALFGPVVAGWYVLDYFHKSYRRSLQAARWFLPSRYVSGHPAIPHALRDIALSFSDSMMMIYARQLIGPKLHLGDIPLRAIQDVTARSETRVQRIYRLTEQQGWPTIPSARRIPYSFPVISVHWIEGANAYTTVFEFDTENSEADAIAFTAEVLKRSDEAKARGL